jgi:hypothetical protein
MQFLIELMLILWIADIILNIVIINSNLLLFIEFTIAILIFIMIKHVFHCNYNFIIIDFIKHIVIIIINYILDMTYYYILIIIIITLVFYILYLHHNIHSFHSFHSFHCSICFDNKINTCCIPCGHIYCDKCIIRTTRCFICRTQIQRKITIYFN